MKENTKSIKYQRIDTGIAGPEMLLLAGVHGDEYEPMLATLELVRHLPGLLGKGSVSIVTVVNQSAYEASSRYGSDGLDLARICPGKIDGTVSEIVASEVSALIRKADYLVDMHTGGVMYDIAPLAGYMLHSAVEILEKQRQMAIAFDLPIIWGTDSHPDGRTLSVARDAGVPAIYLEFGGGTGVRPRVVQAYKEGFIKVLESIGMIVNQKVTVSAVGRFWVEDHRRDSGYLQGKMPAPADGIFVSAVTLGEVIEEGQLWGTIIDPFTGISTAVLADLAGLVFLERKLVKVKKGDALGGILPIEKPGKKIIYA